MSESNFPPDFSRVTEAIWKGCSYGLLTATEARANLRLAGMVLDDGDEVIDPEPIRLPTLDPDADGDDGDQFDDPDFEEAA